MSDRIVGVIGTGIMGEPMARNLLGAGYEVHLFTRTRAKAEALLAEGAKWLLGGLTRRHHLRRPHQTLSNLIRIEFL